MRGAWAEARRHVGWLALLASAAALLFALAHWRGRISEALLPDSRLNQRLEKAAAALERGELSRADGQGARELYEAALAVDPDQMTARAGLAKVRAAAVAEAERALRAHRLAQARRSLRLARELSAPAEQLQPLQAQLRDLERASGAIPGLLAQAGADGVARDRALDLYRQVLAMDGENPIALEGQRALLEAQLAQARQWAAAGKVRAARALVDDAIARDPAHLDLPQTQAALTQAQARLQREQDDELRRAAVDERQGRWSRAVQRYRRLLEESPDLAAARAGLRRCAERYAALASRQAADFRFAQARASLARAREADPGAAAIAVAERRLAQARQTKARLDRAGGGRREELPRRLAQARSALQRGDLIEPPGASAWDQLRVAMAIAPDDHDVRRLQSDYRDAATRCFDQALLKSDLRRGQICLDARQALDPGSPAVTAARAALAARWRAFAEERIAASDFPAAHRAIGAWLRLAPGDPRRAEIQARLQRAEGGARQP